MSQEANRALTHYEQRAMDAVEGGWLDTLRALVTAARDETGGRVEYRTYSDKWVPAHVITGARWTNFSDSGSMRGYTGCPAVCVMDEQGRTHEIINPADIRLAR